MPILKVNPGDVDQQLFETFSRLGYDGATMELLSKATGLKKASLYHRFPGGKKQMALQVLDNMEKWLDENVESVLTDKSVAHETRIRKAFAALSDIYSGENANCVLRMLSAGADAAIFQKKVAACFTRLINGFTSVAIENGLPKTIAKTKAMEAVMGLQGALVLARAMNDKTITKNWIAGIPALLAI